MAMGRSSFHDCGFRDLGSRGEDIKLSVQGKGGILALLAAGIHRAKVTSDITLKLEFEARTPLSPSSLLNAAYNFYHPLESLTRVNELRKEVEFWTVNSE